MNKWVKVQGLQTNPDDIMLFEPKYGVAFYQPKQGIKYRNNYKNDILYHLIGEDKDNLRGEEYKLLFTALGYSYNWYNFSPDDPKNMKDSEHIGTSEFVLKGGSQYELDGVYQTLDYITNEHPVNLLDKDSSSLKIDKQPEVKNVKLQKAS